MKLGFIGIGIMGAPMVGHLLDGGHEVALHNRKSIPQDLLKIKKKNEWSIQENVGHLITVDDLFIGRLVDYESGAKSLRPADVYGKATNKQITIQMKYIIF